MTAFAPPLGDLTHVAASRPRERAAAPTAEASDAELMRAFGEGADAAFAVLFDRHSEAVYRNLLRLTQDRAAATDLTQSTFLSVVKSRDRFIAGTCFRVWLYVIAMNAWRDLRRRAGREVLSGDGTFVEGSYLPVVRDPGLERAVHAALARLPAAQREVVVLHQWEGFSFKEIAELLGVSESAAKVRAHRAYERLRGLLDGVWGGDG